MRTTAVVGLLCLGIGFYAGRYILQPHGTSATVDSLASALQAARDSAQDALGRGDTLAAYGDSLGALKDSISVLQGQLLARPRPPAPKGTASDSAAYWEERARAAEADLFEFSRLDAVEDSVQSAEVDAWRAAYLSQRVALVDLLAATATVQDSLRRLSPKVARLEKAAGKVCGVGPAVGIGPNGKPAAVLGIYCDASRLIEKAVAAVF